MLNKHFVYFCSWILSIDKRDNPKSSFIREEFIKDWVTYFHLVLDNDEKIINVKTPRKVGYSTFIAFYLFYYCIVNDNAKIVVVEPANENVMGKISLLNSEMTEIKKGEIIKKTSAKRMTFFNGSLIKFMNTSTYNLRGENDLDIVFFEETEIKNTQKIHFDIINTKVKDKMILSNNIDLSISFPEITTKIIK